MHQPHQSEPVKSSNTSLFSALALAWAWGRSVSQVTPAPVAAAGVASSMAVEGLGRDTTLPGITALPPPLVTGMTASGLGAGALAFHLSSFSMNGAAPPAA